VSFNVQIEDLREGVKVVRPDGRLDSNSYKSLEDALGPVTASYTGTLVFHMARLEFISSAGLSVLFKTRKVLEKQGGRVVFTALPPQIEKVFEIVKALPDTSIFTSVEEADAYLTSIQEKEIEKHRDG
jgi:anti-anti-sigma factor